MLDNSEPGPVLPQAHTFTLPRLVTLACFGTDQSEDVTKSEHSHLLIIPSTRSAGSRWRWDGARKPCEASCEGAGGRAEVEQRSSVDGRGCYPTHLIGWISSRLDRRDESTRGTTLSWRTRGRAAVEAKRAQPTPLASRSACTRFRCYKMTSESLFCCRTLRSRADPNEFVYSP